MIRPYCNLTYPTRYALELILKLVGFGLSFFTKPWMWLDFFVVAIGVVFYILRFADVRWSGIIYVLTV